MKGRSVFDNWADHLSASGTRTVVLVLTLAALALVAFKVVREQRTYGSLAFLGTGTKVIGGIALAALVVQAVQLSRPVTIPSTGQVAVVIGNTANTPRPRLASDVTELLGDTMMLHQGEPSEDLVASFAFVSATAVPEVLPLDGDELRLAGIGMNSTRAKRDVRRNVQALQEHLDALSPTQNGANYLEAILLASQNVEPQSNIVVIGSGLSDAGDLDFAHGNLLTSEGSREKAVDALREKYGANYLAGSTVYFSGLGDTADPQYPLSTRQKDIVRDLYKDAVLAIGGRARIDSTTQVGKAVDTEFVVDATDTACGELARTFTEDSIRFVSDQATYVDPAQAEKALRSLVRLYQRSPDAVRKIQIAGFIANESGAPKIGPGGQRLSEDRAQAVLESLVELGIPREKLGAVGKGYGPHADPQRPELDRMVKVTISRENPDC